MKFTGTDNYVATQDLMLAVNAAMTLQRPLLVKGEPGTGKTMLAEEVAQALGMPLLQWHIKSTTKAQQGLYEYDAVSRLRDSQMADLDGGSRVKDIQNYIIKLFIGVGNHNSSDTKITNGIRMIRKSFAAFVIISKLVVKYGIFRIFKKTFRYNGQRRSF